jgi:hypothetical protein
LGKLFLDPKIAGTYGVLNGATCEVSRGCPFDLNRRSWL